MKIISNQVSRGALAGALGSAGVENVQGEVQKKLALISNVSFIVETGRRRRQHLGDQAATSDVLAAAPCRFGAAESCTARAGGRTQIVKIWADCRSGTSGCRLEPIDFRDSPVLAGFTRMTTAREVNPVTPVAGPGAGPGPLRGAEGPS